MPVARGRLARAGVLGGGAVLVFLLGWGAHAWRERPDGGGAQRRVRLRGMRLVSPLLDVELPEGYTIRHEPIPFRAKLRAYVDGQIRAGRVKEMSVYYRDLLDGPWFGVHEDRKYNPASMGKVPVLIAWLKRAERDPRALAATFTFDERAYPGGTTQRLPPERSLAPGRPYTVEELLRYMLAYSDNRAMWVLWSHLGEEELADVLDSMDVSNDASSAVNAMSVHGYSGFYRVLFNAAYLNRELSEKALELLALQDFPQGFQAGIPKGVTLAGKFGEWAGADGEVQLHEFGIVYHRRSPYILGVMTIGRDWEAQARILREVSAMVWSEIDAQEAEQAQR